MRNIIFIIIFLLVCGKSVAESYSDVSTVRGMSVGAGYSRINLASMKVVEGCSSTKFYWLDTSINKEMFSTLLAAKANGQKVSLQLVGCNGDMAKITHVYLCDVAFCN